MSNNFTVSQATVYMFICAMLHSFSFLLNTDAHKLREMRNYEALHIFIKIGICKH